MYNSHTGTIIRKCKVFSHFLQFHQPSHAQPGPSIKLTVQAVWQAIISRLSCSHQVINKSSSRCQAVVRQLSGCCQVLLSGSHQIVIRHQAHTSGCHKADVTFFLFFLYPVRRIERLLETYGIMQVDSNAT